MFLSLLIITYHFKTLYIKNYILFIFVCLCMYTSVWTCHSISVDGQRTSCRYNFFSSTMWVSGTDLGSSGLASSIYWVFTCPALYTHMWAQIALDFWSFVLLFLSFKMLWGWCACTLWILSFEDRVRHITLFCDVEGRIKHITLFCNVGCGMSHSLPWAVQFYTETALSVETVCC